MTWESTAGSHPDEGDVTAEAVRQKVEKGQLGATDAVALIDGVLRNLVAVSPSIAFQLLLQKAEALRKLKNLDGAINALASAVELGPDNEPALSQLSALMVQAGRTAEAKQYRDRLFELQARRLPERLSDGLRDLWQQASDNPIDSTAVEWAWELADKATWQRAEWQVAATWGMQSRLLLRNWAQWVPHKADQLDALLEERDLGDLSAVANRGGPCLIVGAHVGPSPGAAKFLRRAKLQFHLLANADLVVAHGKTYISVKPDPVATLRPLVEKLRSGGRIAIMGDSPLAWQSYAVAFLGRQVELPAIVPRLIQSCGAASFWCCPLWRDGRIALEFERLPDPMQGEPRDEWSQRWFAAYLDRLERVMRGRPENLGLFSGIWANVSSAVLVERQKRASSGGRSRD